MGLDLALFDHVTDLAGSLAKDLCCFGNRELHGADIMSTPRVESQGAMVRNG
jgi:hypothetical protein